MKLSAPQLLAAVALAVSSLAHAQDANALTPPYSALYVFGDSLSDGGNAALGGAVNPGQVITGNSYVPSAAYASNTFSNGPTWVSLLAPSLGLTASQVGPSFAGGTNYAVGGATTTGANSATTQLSLAPASLPSTALYVVAIGGNDIRNTLAAATANPANAATIVNNAVTAYATAMNSILTTLQTRGATNIIVWGAPDVGLSPAALATGPAGASFASQVSGAFNTGLLPVVNARGATFFNVASYINNWVTNPGANGFSNVTDACGAPSNACNTTVSSALFWDGIHPTSFTQGKVAQAMLAVAAVPEPSTYALFALGVAGLGLATRRRRTQAVAA